MLFSFFHPIYCNCKQKSALEYLLALSNYEHEHFFLLHGEMILHILFIGRQRKLMHQKCLHSFFFMLAFMHITKMARLYVIDQMHKWIVFEGYRSRMILFGLL